MLIRILAIVLCMFCSVPSLGVAATFDVKPKSGDSAAVVVVIGDFDLEDEKSFIQAVLPLDSAVVVLTSNGGNLYAGIEIGKAIRLKSLSTLVPRDSVCASACAIAWLAGDHRFVDVNGQVGFHSAYTEDAGKKIPNGMANAVVGAYLSQLGFSQSAVIYVTSAPPEGIQWLSESDAKKNGVDVTYIGKDEARISETPVKSPVPISPLKQRQGADFVGFDLPGMPIKDTSLSECDIKCQASSECKAFTYNLMHPACYLKRDAKIALRNAVAVSGYTPGMETNIVFSRIEVQSRTDFPGGDYHHNENVTFADCVNLCEQEGACKAFSFIAKKKQCWLKTSVTSAKPKAGVVSGFKVEP